LGALFLLNNLGWLSWNVWQMLFTLWPVWLIAVGLDILIGRRSVWGSLLVLVVVIGIVGVLTVVYSVQPLATNTWTSETVSQALAGATRADIEIAFTTGSLRIQAAPEDAALIEGTLNVRQNERVTRDFSVNGDTAYFKLRGQNTDSGPWWGWGKERDKVWSLQLNRTVPLRLKVNTGVGTSTLNLESLNVTSLDVNAGVGRTVLTLPNHGQLSAQVDGGVGETEVTIPEGMAAKIRVRTGLGNTQVNSRYQRQGDYYLSPNYDTATNRVELTVNGGIGSITIR
jgi:hypothetical protein